ncbi:HAMP domain-containing protein [Crassaminicella thermophila]|uniref:histidine kinase n=1 Tax=Crassaminicella thermophila TaxID=2599308 RepID=A0A5C0SG48_CRATE|nr:HAMP domain-containing sensor histidine kinase [Crassaminicella thermophila]QEK13463.1 HAMP domain-containing protein [Crassaminicella thermophila]
MKLRIKKKLIFPLLILMIMPVLILGIFTYWNYNKTLINYEILRINNELNNILVLLSTVDKNNNDKAFILDYIKSLKKENMFIIEKNKFLYNTLKDKSINEQKILKSIKYDQEISSQYLLQYGVYHQWNWKIGFLIDKEAIPYKNHEINKVILLLIPLFIFFSLEAIILITDNISKPIGILLEAYNDMISGNFKKKINIKRKDELGLLGHAFNEMRNEIASKTNKFIEMKNFNEDILRSISTGIITTNINGKVIKYNQAAVNIIEKTTQNNPIIIKVLLSQIMNTLKTQKSINQVKSFKSKEEGRNIYLDITTSLMKNTNQENIGVICSFNDISSRKRIEEKIDQINRLTSLGQLTAALSHEIRNPLSGMKMSCQVLKKRLSSHLNLSDKKLFDATIYEIDRLDELITDLLSFAKPNLPKFQVVNVYEVLENALQFSSKIISQKNINVLKEFEENCLLAYFDKNQLAQIFLNIIANAIWAMDNEGTLKIKAKKFIEEKEYILIIFEDNGCGISKENIHKIFDPFYTTNKTGTGLGLSVVHKLITANHGEIEVESQINIGTKIKLYIPLYRRDKNEKKSVNN